MTLRVPVLSRRSWEDVMSVRPRRDGSDRDARRAKQRRSRLMPITRAHDGCPAQSSVLCRSVRSAQAVMALDMCAMLKIPR